MKALAALEPGAAGTVASGCAAGACEGAMPFPAAVGAALALAQAVPESVLVPVGAAAGRIASRDLRAMKHVPPFRNAAMDGYAVRTADFAGGPPWHLPVAGRVAAGDEAGRPANAGAAAIRIFTGAPIPDGFDAVVKQEACILKAARIIIDERPQARLNIRQAGEDVESGAIIVEGGQSLSPARLASLASAGVSSVAVRRRVRIGVLSCGSELRQPGEELSAGMIYDANRVMLLSSLQSCSWADTFDAGVVRDDRAVLARRLAELLCACDVVVTSGGASAGEEDRIAAAAEALGVHFAFKKISMRPGKPVKAGSLGGKLLFVLPGNPFAAAVAFQFVTLPAIRKLSGMARFIPDLMVGICDFDYRKRSTATEFVPVAIAGQDPSDLPLLRILGRGSSASLAPYAAADGIAVLHPERSSLAEGDRLQVHWLEQN